MARTRGLIVKKPSTMSPGYSDVFGLDMQIEQSTNGSWAFGPNTIYGFIAHGLGTAYTTSGFPFTIFKKFEDNRFYPQPAPDMMPSYTNGVGVPHLSPNKQLLVVAMATTGLLVYKYDSSYYTDYKYQGAYSPSPAATVGPVKFHPSGSYIAYGRTTTSNINQIEIWSVSSSGVLTYVSGAHPSGTTTSRTIKSLEWSPDGTKLLVTHPSITPGWSLYSFSAGTLTDITPSGLTGAPSAITGRWSGDGNYFSLAFNATPYVRVYSVSGNTATALTVPTMTTTSVVTINSDGTNFIYTDGVAGSANGLMWLQRTAGTSTLTKLSNVGPLYWTVSGINDIGFLSDTELMLMGRFSAVFRVAASTIVDDLKDLMPPPYAGDYIAQGQPRFTSNTFLEQNSLSPGGFVILRT